jgi:hypothetical protein
MFMLRDARRQKPLVAAGGLMAEERSDAGIQDETVAHYAGLEM